MAKLQKKSVITYIFERRERNPNYEKNLIKVKIFLPVNIRTCLISYNSAKDNFVGLRDSPDSYYICSGVCYVKFAPKWFYYLSKHRANVVTGEMEKIGMYVSDEIKRSNYRKITAVEKFCDKYEPLYKQKKVSILFHTFTRVQNSRIDMSRMMDVVKRQYAKIGRKIRGYLWVQECKKNRKMGVHVHYHLIVAIDRLQVRKIPDELKFETYWGQRTGVEFVKKSVRRYCYKYLTKGGGKVIGCRSYSVSRKLE